MAKIDKLPALTHGRLEGVAVYPLSGAPAVGVDQEVLVVVDPGVSIPLHRHSASATMFIVNGSTRVLSDDRAMNGRRVGLGDVVEFEANVNHGFAASEVGFSFVSRNGGIVDGVAAAWDMQFSMA